MISSSNQVFIDYTPTTYKQKLQKVLHKTPKQCQSYVLRLFPIIHWIHRYNLSVSHTRFTYNVLINVYSGCFKMQLQVSLWVC
jgi:hypothetical protein